MDLDISYSMDRAPDKSHEHNLWFTLLLWKMDDAMGTFRLPYFTEGVPDLDIQYRELRHHYLKSGERILSRDELYNNSDGKGRSAPRARSFLESQAFDDISMMIGYDTHFINSAFALVQKAITYEKKLWDEFGIDINIFTKVG